MGYVLGYMLDYALGYALGYALDYALGYALGYSLGYPLGYALGYPLGYALNYLHIMLMFSLILSAALAVALFRAFLFKRDIRQLSEKLAYIVKTDTNVQLTTNTFDKHIAVLAVNINHMLARNRQEHMDKIRAEADLKRAITNISHDLRTPLTSAFGYLQMLEDGILGGTQDIAQNPAPHPVSNTALNNTLDIETQKRYFAIIRGRLASLSTLMNDLFTFARIIEENAAIEENAGAARQGYDTQRDDTQGDDSSKVNIGNVLRDVLSASYAELAAKGFTVETDIPDTPVFCYGDREALRRVLQNLMMNVCVHGSTYLRVKLENPAEGPTIEIANKGVALAELDTERIFDRFYTADASRTSKNTGLGLAIAKELIKRMGGQITAYVTDYAVNHSADYVTDYAVDPAADKGVDETTQETTEKILVLRLLLRY